jgi:hypothetical protein
LIPCDFEEPGTKRVAVVQRTNIIPNLDEGFMHDIIDAAVLLYEPVAVIVHAVLVKEINLPKCFSASLSKALNQLDFR